MPASLEQTLAQAIAHYNAGRLDDAEIICRALVHRFGREPALLQLLATILFKRGSIAAARAAISESLAARPSHVGSLLMAGRIAQSSGDWPEAKQFFARAAELAPDAREPVLLLSLALAQTGDSQALEVLARVMPADAESWCELGFALKAAGALREALQAFTRALDIDPDVARAEAGRGALLHALGQHHEAIASLQRAWVLNPQSAAIGHDLGLALHAAGALERAGEVLERALELEPALAQAWFRLGLVRQDQRRLREAAVAFQRALACRTDYAEAAVNLGIVLQEDGNLDDALLAYRQAVRMRGDTIGRIAQALTAASKGRLWLDPARLLQSLGA
jgi:tetratricopeptide (TPR) repeat protein